MKGTVQVVDAPTADVPAQSDITRRLRRNGPTIEMTDAARQQAQQARVEAGPNNTILCRAPLATLTRSRRRSGRKCSSFLPKFGDHQSGRHGHLGVRTPYFHNHHVFASYPTGRLYPGSTAGARCSALDSQSGYLTPSKPSPVYDATKETTPGCSTPAGPLGTTWAL